ncbi:MAG: hypothetical protein PHQ98_01515 [Candidatus ainarchaeum sp.]|nr:hypothetical protein [Candidatus ainarchaeum sp.]
MDTTVAIDESGDANISYIINLTKLKEMNEKMNTLDIMGVNTDSNLDLTNVSAFDQNDSNTTDSSVSTDNSFNETDYLKENICQTFLKNPSNTFDENAIVCIPIDDYILEIKLKNKINLIGKGLEITESSSQIKYTLTSLKDLNLQTNFNSNSISGDLTNNTKFEENITDVNNVDEIDATLQSDNSFVIDDDQIFDEPTNYNSPEMMKSMGFEMNLIIKMPGEIQKSTIGLIDRNTQEFVTIDLIESAKEIENFEIISTIEKPNYDLLFIAGGIVLILLVILIIFKLKSNKDVNELKEIIKAKNSL